MRQFITSSACAFALVIFISGACAAEPQLMVIDESGQSHPFTAKQISQLPHHTLKAKAHDVESQFEGVWLVDLLQAAGITFGESLRGNRAACVALVDAADGYRIPIALLEIDPATTDKAVLLAVLVPQIRLINSV